MAEHAGFWMEVDRSAAEYLWGCSVFLKYGEHGFMEMPVACDELVAVDGVIRS